MQLYLPPLQINPYLHPESALSHLLESIYPDYESSVLIRKIPATSQIIYS